MIAYFVRESRISWKVNTDWRVLHVFSSVMPPGPAVCDMPAGHLRRWNISHSKVHKSSASATRCLHSIMERPTTLTSTKHPPYTPNRYYYDSSHQACLPIFIATFSNHKRSLMIFHSEFMKCEQTEDVVIDYDSYLVK